MTVLVANGKEAIVLEQVVKITVGGQWVQFYSLGEQFTVALDGTEFEIEDFQLEPVVKAFAEALDSVNKFYSKRDFVELYLVFKD